jgi:hydroxymethylglutaryl-CoA reductase
MSNFADRRLARAEAVFPAADLGGPAVVDALVEAYELADADPYRATTHNKGTMNGIDAVVLATGNDWRAVEAGAHAWAARDGRYRSLTSFAKTKAGDLKGRIELPLALGITGGAKKATPVATVALKILGAKSARELATIVASVGLAQNLAALRALVTDGIQKGHMRLHERLKGRTKTTASKR